jgi:CRISPR/Cas system CSM-associated protein Csm3 (group 7 of RAMP superfamily)
MLKRRLCEASFQWSLHCEGPLLVADGRYEKPKNAPKEHPQKVFVSHATDAALGNVGPRPEALRLPFYVPGTSLRGPFRAQAERIVRSLRPAEALPPATACDPFEMKEGKPLTSCSKRLDATRTDAPYAAACPACKLFGCTGTASRIQFADADIPSSSKPHGAVRSVYRDMIGIDRFTGGVHLTEDGHGANMRLHALENAWDHRRCAL